MENKLVRQMVLLFLRFTFSVAATSCVAPNYAQAGRQQKNGKAKMRQLIAGRAFY